MSPSVKEQVAPSLHLAPQQPITAELIAAAVAGATTYNVKFDFTQAQEKTILQYLQDNGYQLLAYKGASGPNPVSAGLPTWFAMPFANIYGKYNIAYTPVYKVYVYNEIDITEDTVISMEQISSEVPLGTSLTFDSVGNFNLNGTPAPAGKIRLKNDRPAGTPNLTVGLAAKINGAFAPFCAFTITPGGSIDMTPHENAVFFAAQTDLQSGSVTANAAAPGALFTFNGGTLIYNLAIEDSTYAVVGDAGTIVSPVDSGAALSMLLA